MSTTSNAMTATAGTPTSTTTAHLEQHRQHDLDRMETQPGGYIDVEVGVVHPVQPPQQRYFMKRHVLGVDREIERQEDPSKQPSSTGGHGVMFEEPPAALRRNRRDTDRRDREKQPHQRRVEQQNAEIAGPARRAADAPCPARGE